MRAPDYTIIKGLPKKKVAKVYLHMLNESSSKKMLDKIQLQEFECQNAKRKEISRSMERQDTRNTCIISDHDDVCRESPPIFIEISGE